jgi:hypothetical protein
MSRTQADRPFWLVAMAAFSARLVSLWVVLMDMLCLRLAQHEIVNAIVQFVTVDVMHDFTWSQWAPKVFLHDEAMDKQDAALAIDHEIAHRINGAMSTFPRRPFWASLPGELALTRAKGTFSVELAWWSCHWIAAVGARLNEWSHGAIVAQL